jgi:hypothetical protein
MFRWLSTPTQQHYPQCLVLDIDETLAHTRSSSEKATDEIKAHPDYYTVSTREGIFWGTKRPHLDEFLAYCNTRFEAVGFWSAGKEGYVNEMVRVMAPPFTPSFVMNFNHCDQIPEEHVNETGAVSYNHELRKPLNTVFDKHPVFTRYNTFIVDDRFDYAKSNLLNWIIIPPYSPPLKKILPPEDDYLLRLIDWFERTEVKDTPNVLEIDKNWV